MSEVIDYMALPSTLYESTDDDATALEYFNSGMKPDLHFELMMCEELLKRKSGATRYFTPDGSPPAPRPANSSPVKKSGHGITCKFCGQDGFSWQETISGWRLFDSNGEQHWCGRN